MRVAEAVLGEVPPLLRLSKSWDQLYLQIILRPSLEAFQADIRGIIPFPRERAALRVVSHLIPRSDAIWACKITSLSISRVKPSINTGPRLLKGGHPVGILVSQPGASIVLRGRVNQCACFFLRYMTQDG